MRSSSKINDDGLGAVLEQLHGSPRPKGGGSGRQSAVRRSYSAHDAAVDAKKLSTKQFLQERLVKDYFRESEQRTQLQAEELLNRGVLLEDAGRLQEACQAYDRVLTLEPHNLELRKYLGTLYSKINSITASKSKHLESPQGGRTTEGLSLIDQMNVHKSAGQAHHLRKPQGGAVQPSKLGYMKDLDQQVIENQKRQAKMRADEKLLEKKEVEAQEMKQRLEKYNEHVHSGNEKLGWKITMASQRQKDKERRIQNYAQERQSQLEFSPRGIFAGEGEREVQAQRQSDIWSSGDRASSYYHAPSSRVAYQDSYSMKREAATHHDPWKLNEDQRQARYPGIRPKSAQPQRPAAPFSRPSIDNPVAEIDPSRVAARQKAWVAKHQKEKPRNERQLSPHNHQRISDVLGFRADEVSEQLKKAAAKGEAVRKGEMGRQKQFRN